MYITGHTSLKWCWYVHPPVSSYYRSARVLQTGHYGTFWWLFLYSVTDILQTKNRCHTTFNCPQAPHAAKCTNRRTRTDLKELQLFLWTPEKGMFENGCCWRPHVWFCTDHPFDQITANHVLYKHKHIQVYQILVIEQFRFLANCVFSLSAFVSN